MFAIVANLAEGQLVQGWVQICASWNPDTIGGLVGGNNNNDNNINDDNNN